MKKRLKSPVVWAAVLSQILLIVGVLIPNISDSVKIIGGAVIEILTVVGILNNPTDCDNF